MRTEEVFILKKGRLLNVTNSRVDPRASQEGDG
jgi:hypothetical protein